MKTKSDLHFEKILKEALEEEFFSEIEKTGKEPFKPSEDFQRKMDRLFSGQAEKSRSRLVLKRVAVFFLVISSTFGLIFTSDKPKEKIYSWFIQNPGENIVITGQKPEVEEVFIKKDNGFYWRLESNEDSEWKVEEVEFFAGK